MDDVRIKPGIIRGLTILLFVFIVNYFLARAVFIYYAQYSLVDKYFSIFFFLSEIFVMFHAFGYFSNVYRRNRETPDKLYIKPLKEYPDAAILIPARHEPKEILENTLICCYNLNYPDKAIYLLDDSSDEKYKNEAEELCRKYECNLFRRKERHGAKAGIINDCIKGLRQKYIVIFDVDQNPLPDFLLKLIPIVEADPKLAFVQTPQFYSNLQNNAVSFASNMQQAVFYEYVCEGKGTKQAMICCGTNVVIRREALLDVGGLDESSVTEDFATSIKLHMKGWRSRYHGHVYTFGMGPEELGSYFKQQNRWAMGNVGVFRKIIGKFLRHPFALKPAQWFEYMITGSYYLIGWAYLFLLLCPITYIFFNIPSFFMDPVVYGFTFLPYLFLSLGIFYSSMASYHYGIRELFKGQLLSFITLPVYARASLCGLAGIKGRFQVTAKSGARRISYFKLWPQLLIWAISLTAIAWGINRFIYERTPAIMLNVVWVAYHFMLLSGIFYFNEEQARGRYKKLLKKSLFEYKIIEDHASQEGAEPVVIFGVLLNQDITEGTLIMCKVVPPGNKDDIIFDARVLESSKLIMRKGYHTTIGVTKIPEIDKTKLERLLVR